MTNYHCNIQYETFMLGYFERIILEQQRKIVFYPINKQQLIYLKLIELEYHKQKSVTEMYTNKIASWQILHLYQKLIKKYLWIRQTVCTTDGIFNSQIDQFIKYCYYWQYVGYCRMDISKFPSCIEKI